MTQANTTLSVDAMLAELDAVGANNSPVIGKTAEVSKTRTGRAIFKLDNIFPERQGGRININAHCITLQHSDNADGSQTGRAYKQSWNLYDPKAPAQQRDPFESMQYLNLALVALELKPVDKATWKEDLARVVKELNGLVATVDIVANKTPGFPPVVYFNAGCRRRDLEGKSNEELMRILGTGPMQQGSVASI